VSFHIENYKSFADFDRTERGSKNVAAERTTFLREW